MYGRRPDWLTAVAALLGCAGADIQYVALWSHRTVLLPYLAVPAFAPAVGAKALATHRKAAAEPPPPRDLL